MSIQVLIAECTTKKGALAHLKELAKTAPPTEILKAARQAAFDAFQASFAMGPEALGVAGAVAKSIGSIRLEELEGTKRQFTGYRVAGIPIDAGWTGEARFSDVRVSVKYDGETFAGLVYYGGADEYIGSVEGSPSGCLKAAGDLVLAKYPESGVKYAGSGPRDLGLDATATTIGVGCFGKLIGHVLRGNMSGVSKDVSHVLFAEELDAVMDAILEDGAKGPGSKLAQAWV
ncbi:MAG: hypothetical protein ABIH26_14195, partial [Candidatus Eisenbacteria bacterium]